MGDRSGKGENKNRRSAARSTNSVEAPNWKIMAASKPQES